MAPPKRPQQKRRPDTVYRAARGEKTVAFSLNKESRAQLDQLGEVYGGKKAAIVAALAALADSHSRVALLTGYTRKDLLKLLDGVLKRLEQEP